MKIDVRRLQHTFSKHAPDFGLSGSWNQAQAALLEQILQKHVANPAVQRIVGTYRGNIAVTHYFDPAADLWVAVDRLDNFIAGWKLSAAQRTFLLRSGNIK